jgi:RNA-binding protein
MLTSKQRAQLRAMANGIDTVLTVGKDGVSPQLTEAVNEALEARELIKLGILSNCADDPRSVAEMLSGRTRSEVVQIIGKKIVLYRKNKKKPVIEL